MQSSETNGHRFFWIHLCKEQQGPRLKAPLPPPWGGARSRRVQVHYQGINIEGWLRNSLLLPLRNDLRKKKNQTNR